VKPATVKFANLDKQRIKVQKAYYRLDRLDCVRKDYINKIVSVLVRTKPAYITIEDLNILGMMKSKHLSKAIEAYRSYKKKKKNLDYYTFV
jgi:putative transposase